MKPDDVVDEGSLDPEALQAQIDMSMSFAQNLVSSWLDPSKFSKSSRKQDLEKELTDYMRRPPRLGVGATVPAGHHASMSRETARLKGKLAGTKRPREQDGSTSKLLLDDNDDEGESKAHAIKKRAKVDPFDVVHGKKKKKQKHSTQAPPTPLRRATSAPLDEDSSGEVAGILLQSPTKPIANDAASWASSPKKSKKKKRKGSKDRIDKSNASVASDSEDNPEEEAHGKSKSLHAESVSADSVSGTPHSPKKKGSLDMSKFPLLNLTGPPASGDESGGEVEGASATSPKKKRKRRKKKKNTMVSVDESAMDVDDV